MTDIPKEAIKAAAPFIHSEEIKLLQNGLGACRAALDISRKAGTFNDGIEAAARIAEGSPHHTFYRTWPWWGEGNRHQERDIVKHADKIAAAIRALKKE